jgi:hypothetical protein
VIRNACRFRFAQSIGKRRSHLNAALCLSRELMKKIGLYLLNLALAAGAFWLFIMSLYNSLPPESYGPETPNLFWKYGFYVLISFLVIYHARSKLFLLICLLAIWGVEIANQLYAEGLLTLGVYIAFILLITKAKIPKENS